MRESDPMTSNTSIQNLILKLQNDYLPELVTLHHDCQWLLSKLSICDKKDVHSNEARLMQFVTIVENTIKSVKSYNPQGCYGGDVKALLEEMENTICRAILPVKSKLLDRLNQQLLRGTEANHPSPTSVATTYSLSRQPPPPPLLLQQYPQALAMSAEYPHQHNKFDDEDTKERGSDYTSESTLSDREANSPRTASSSKAVKLSVAATNHKAAHAGSKVSVGKRNNSTTSSADDTSSSSSSSSLSLSAHLARGQSQSIASSPRGGGRNRASSQDGMNKSRSVTSFAENNYPTQIVRQINRSSELTGRLKERPVKSSDSTSSESSCNSESVLPRSYSASAVLAPKLVSASKKVSPLTAALYGSKLIHGAKQDKTVKAPVETGTYPNPNPNAVGSKPTAEESQVGSESAQDIYDKLYMQWASQSLSIEEGGTDNPFLADQPGEEGADPLLREDFDHFPYEAIVSTGSGGEGGSGGGGTTEIEPSLHKHESNLFMLDMGGGATAAQTEAGASIPCGNGGDGGDNGVHLIELNDSLDYHLVEATEASLPIKPDALPEYTMRKRPSFNHNVFEDEFHDVDCLGLCDEDHAVAAHDMLLSGAPHDGSFYGHFAEPVSSVHAHTSSLAGAEEARTMLSSERARREGGDSTSASPSKGGGGLKRLYSDTNIAESGISGSDSKASKQQQQQQQLEGEAEAARPSILGHLEMVQKPSWLKNELMSLLQPVAASSSGHWTVSTPTNAVRRNPNQNHASTQSFGGGSSSEGLYVKSAVDVETGSSNHPAGVNMLLENGVPIGEEFMSSRRRRRLNQIVPNPRKPRQADYTCSICAEGYRCNVNDNPWWAVYMHVCPRCKQIQIPRIDINIASNAIELDPNNIALYGEGIEEGGEGDADGDEYTDDEESNENASNQGEAVEGVGEERVEEEEEEKPFDGEGLLQKEEASKLLVLMCHARTCSGSHASAKHADICNSTKYLMLHIRDCKGQDVHGRECQLPWCLPCRKMLRHLTKCFSPDHCAVCNPWGLPESYQQLRRLNQLRLCQPANIDGMISSY